MPVSFNGDWSGIRTHAPEEIGGTFDADLSAKSDFNGKPQLLTKKSKRTRVKNSSFIFKNFTPRVAQKWRDHFKTKKRICLNWSPGDTSPDWLFYITHKFMVKIRPNKSCQSWKMVTTYPSDVGTDPEKLHVKWHPDCIERKCKILRRKVRKKCKFETRWIINTFLNIEINFFAVMFIGHIYEHERCTLYSHHNLWSYLNSSLLIIR